MTNLSETPLHRGDVIEFPSFREEGYTTKLRLNSTDVMRQPVSGMVVSVIQTGKCQCCGNPKSIRVSVFIPDHNRTEDIDGSVEFRILARK